MSHEVSQTVQGPDGLWYNVSNVVWPRLLNGPYAGADTSVSSAHRRSHETDETQLVSPLSPLGAGAQPTPSLWEVLGGLAAQHDATPNFQLLTPPPSTNAPPPAPKTRRPR